MTHSIHEHQWAYLGDLALVVSKREQDVDLRRIEYCVKCSTVRVQFPSGWYEMQGDVTKEFLKHVGGSNAGTVFKITPLEFRPKPPKKSRLGKTLATISNRPMPPLFKK